MLSILDWEPESGLKTNLPTWNSTADTIARNQDDAITSFSIELENLERKMDKNTFGRYNYWYPLIKEAKKDAAHEMKIIIERYRKTQEINAGKQASMSLFSKAARNNFLLRKIIEYVKCISYTTSIFHQVQLLEVEAEIAKQQLQIHNEYGNELKNLEKDLYMELNAIRIECKEMAIDERVQKARSILDSIQKKHIERHEKSISHIHTFVESANAAFGIYIDRLSRIFKDNREPPDESLSNIQTNLHELRFYPLKIEEWRLEQIQIVGQMKAKVILPDLEEALRISFSKPSALKKGKEKIEGEEVKKVYRGKEERRLLDGTLVSSVRDPIKKMETLALVSEPYFGHLLDFTEESSEVVEIYTIQARNMKKKRSELEKKVIADTEIIWKEVYRDISKTILARIETLNAAKIKRFADIEMTEYELKEIMNKRIEQLPQIHLTHENEARLIIDTIHNIRDSFSSKIDCIFSEIDEFAESVVSSTLNTLSKCVNVSDSRKLKEKFDILVERFNFNTSDRIEKAHLEFDHGRKILEKSKMSGNHSSAWIIIKDAGSYDPSTINSLLDNWKNSISDDVSRVQKDIGQQIKNLQKEFEYYQSDLEVSEFTKYKLKNLKTLLRGESISSRNTLEGFMKLVQKAKDLTDRDQTWVKCLGDIELSVQVVQAALKAADYYSILPSKTSYSTQTIFEPEISSWEQWKLHYHYNQLSMDHISISSSIFPTLSRSSIILSRGSNKSGSPPKVEQKFKPTTPSEKKPKSALRQSPQVVSFSTTPTIAVATTPLGKANTANSARIQLSTTRESTTLVEEKKNFLPPLPTKIENDLMPTDPRIECLGFDGLLESWMGTARQSILGNYEKYMFSLKDREIRRIDLLPHPTSQFQAMVDDQLSKFAQQAQNFKKTEIKSRLSIL
jgi:hypothetical protein